MSTIAESAAFDGPAGHAGCRLRILRKLFDGTYQECLWCGESGVPFPATVRLMSGDGCHQDLAGLCVDCLDAGPNRLRGWLDWWGRRMVECYEAHEAQRHGLRDVSAEVLAQMPVEGSA